MLHQAKNVSSTIQEIYATCTQRIKTIQNLNAYVKITEEISRAQLQESIQRCDKGKLKSC